MTKHIIQLITISLLSLNFSCNQIENSEEIKKNDPDHSIVANDSNTISLNGIEIEEPLTYENLGIFIVTGQEKINGKKYKTLSQAMKDKEVIVKETGNVNKLSLDNTSDNYIYINSGDIVKGGKQDRTISYDVIIPPNTKNVALESFCVEQGRWEQRANETVSSFTSNTKMLSSRDLKLAAKHEKNQSNVWNKISEHKALLNDNLSKKNGYTVNVADNESNSSLQLALENRELDSIRNQFYETLKNCIHTPNALGYAYTINGEIYGVEIYNNKQLFKDLWGKILESIIVEAISKQEENRSFSNTRNEVIEYINAIDRNDKKSTKKINKATSLSTLENDKGNVVFTTEDTHEKKWIHKSYMNVNSSAIKKNR